MGQLKQGTFVISLDFELYWGMLDQVPMEQFSDTALGARRSVEYLLALFDKHKIHATWAVVGLLFFASRDDLMAAVPERLPCYTNQRLSPANSLRCLGRDEEDDPLHFGASLVGKIGACANQEIATHTFSHFYCLEDGQTLEDFQQDLAAAKEVAQRSGFALKSLVFPRNQVNQDYIKVLREHGIVAYRGNSIHPQAAPRNNPAPSRLKRGVRFLDSYFNLLGHKTYGHEQITAGPPFNIPASRFLRPYTPRLKALEPLRLRRILASMTRAAQEGQIYHVWWHPHNFARHTEGNLHFLGQIINHYHTLNCDYGMRSCNMSEVAGELSKSASGNMC